MTFVSDLLRCPHLKTEHPDIPWRLLMLQSEDAASQWSANKDAYEMQSTRRTPKELEEYKERREVLMDWKSLHSGPSLY
ncbi:hypothetical protein CALVIDRAFT_536865 [Calocera viscosa TUFC12733]|uniref:Uncharacterized protein n=1 Tax=Calocera viscosa (strain TUFC12733) TaxID=1330018 RepID=A0A167MPR7_CALVF|nr:hypothetical protein CALVIDRAFT_536865 [Calocera viscosa TUFC12733]